MENRNAVVGDYFKLRLLLNRTNLVRDQKTEIVFEAKRVSDFDYRIIATLEGVKDPKYIELCKRSVLGGWEPSEHSGLFSLEDFCVSFITKEMKKIGFSDLIEEEVHKTVKKLQNELRNLGISRE